MIQKNYKKIIKYIYIFLAVFIYVYFMITSTIFLIINLIIFLIILFRMFVYWLNNNFIAKRMSLYNVHMFGKKGRGKDLSTQLVIVKRYAKTYRKIVKKQTKLFDKIGINFSDYVDIYFHYFPLYLSNIDYGYGSRIIDLDELKLIDKNTGDVVTYQSVMDGSYKKMHIEKIDMYEGLDLYISDAQLGLPNTEHKDLDKIYPWLPVFIALSRQLYNMNVIVNTQEYSRLWIKLRGQQDVYFKALNTVPINKSFTQRIWKKLPILKNYMFVKLRYYEEQQSAELNILPFSAKGLVNEGMKHAVLSDGQSIKEQFESTYGVIKDITIVIKISKIKYDSRIFHEYIFGYKAP